MPFDLAVVAAILAVIGYSLNDTVVVFDRIRERFETNRRSPPALVLDQSINQTLSRTIMTKVVTAIVVVALLFLGGPVLKGFSAALLIGIIAGTYSSIYISERDRARLRPDRGARVPEREEGRPRPPAVSGDACRQLLADPHAWLAFLTLSLLEIVLGIDNLIFISILVERLPAQLQNRRASAGWRWRC